MLLSVPTKTVAPVGTAASAARLWTIGATAAARTSAAAHTKILDLRSIKGRIAPVNIGRQAATNAGASCTGGAVDTERLSGPKLDHVAGNICISSWVAFGRAFLCTRPGLFRAGQAGCNRVRRSGFSTPQYGQLRVASYRFYSGMGNRAAATLP